MNTTPNIITWLFNRAPQPTADKYGDMGTAFSCGWKDIRGLHTQLKGLSAKNIGKYKKGTQGGAAPDASYRFTDNDGFVHRIELFPTGRIQYTALKLD